MFNIWWIDFNKSISSFDVNFILYLDPLKTNGLDPFSNINSGTSLKLNFILFFSAYWIASYNILVLYACGVYDENNLLLSICLDRV